MKEENGAADDGNQGLTGIFWEIVNECFSSNTLDHFSVRLTSDLLFHSPTMDHTFLPRSFWAADNKFLQHPADLCSTSVLVTRGVPAGACFGPCALQNTFYDTIAFIAQKSSDRRTKCYVFRVSLTILGCSRRFN